MPPGSLSIESTSTRTRREVVAKACTALCLSLIVYLSGINAGFFRKATFRKLLSMRGGAESGKDENKIDGVCISIDLGTTYSCVAVWKNGRVEICPNEQGNRITPSYVAWSADGTRLVGDAAKNPRAAQEPSNTVFDVKRLIGRKFSDPSVQKDSNYFLTRWRWRRATSLWSMWMLDLE